MSKKKVKEILKLRKEGSYLIPADDIAVSLLIKIKDKEERFFTSTKITEDDLRSAAQNRLMWMWITDMSNTSNNQWSGRTKKEWHRTLKKDYLVPIYERDDEGYAVMLATIRKVYKNGMKDEANILHDHIVEVTSTTDATVKQFAEYLTSISMFCSFNGILLRTNQYLFDLAIYGH